MRREGYLRTESVPSFSRVVCWVCASRTLGVSFYGGILPQTLPRLLTWISDLYSNAHGLPSIGCPQGTLNSFVTAEYNKFPIQLFPAVLYLR